MHSSNWKQSFAIDQNTKGRSIRMVSRKNEDNWMSGKTSNTSRGGPAEKYHGKGEKNTSRRGANIDKGPGWKRNRSLEVKGNDFIIMRSEVTDGKNNDKNKIKRKSGMVLDWRQVSMFW
jgi:hypothetical protein